MGVHLMVNYKIHKSMFCKQVSVLFLPYIFLPCLPVTCGQAPIPKRPQAPFFQPPLSSSKKVSINTSNLSLRRFCSLHKKYIKILPGVCSFKHQRNQQNQMVIHILVETFDFFLNTQCDYHNSLEQRSFLWFPAKRNHCCKTLNKV